VGSLGVGTEATWDVVRKPPPTGRVRPNLTDYEASCREASWERLPSVGQLPGRRGVNIAHAALDAHLPARAHQPAIRWHGRHGERVELTYGVLHERACRFANVLLTLGVDPGDRVYLLLGRVPELHVALLGSLRVRAVVSPMFAAFGPEPLRQRLEIGGGRVLVTTRRLYERKVAAIRSQLPALEHVLLIDDGEPPEGTTALGPLLAVAAPHHELPATDPEDPALLHFTSGTTGQPKGAVHVHGAVTWHHVSAALALDLHPDDVFWCTADPGWVTGTSYGVIAPLTHGATLILDEGDFDAERWYRILDEERVTVWYTAPTAIRMLMRAGPDAVAGHDLSALRFVASVGEALDPAAVVWGAEVLGRPIHDNWWQTETGGIMLANFAATDIHPGSMGRPLPGVEAAVVERDDDGHVTVLDVPDAVGQLALRPGWPSMFRTYLGASERYAACFTDGWYLTGDLVRRDADGGFWFLGRADDVIKSAGHLIGPAEVEAQLTAHPAVVEAGVIGVPDPVAGEVVKAFVTLYAGTAPTEELRRELHGFARAALGPAVAPRAIEFVTDLPKTRSGKILRRLLKARELGLPEGDTSTLEAAP
jgi:acetyl-CoA synthetase